jgi:sugar phosphate isomerase/epimerase
MRRSRTFPRTYQAAIILSLVAVSLSLLTGPVVPADPPGDAGIYAKSNLVAWCVVPFDASGRGPAERAEMLKALGLTKLAYDWRDQHIPSFEEEILQTREQGIEFFAHWTPLGHTTGYEAIIGLIEKHSIHPQLWVIAPAVEAETYEQRVEQSARPLLPYVQDAVRLGCKVALYNHGGWSGEPENLIAMARWLRKEARTEDVGIAYNFHHGHDHLAKFPVWFERMVPYLMCVNLNGMTIGGPKILPVGQGEEDRRILEMIRDSGYRGPIGILDHRETVDARESLEQNLQGLKELLREMGEMAAFETYAP